MEVRDESTELGVTSLQNVFVFEANDFSLKKLPSNPSVSFDITKTNQKLYVRLSLGTCLVVQILASYNNTFYPEMFAPT